MTTATSNAPSSITTVLWADDEIESFGSTIATLEGKYGFRILKASNVSQAAEIARTHGHELDELWTDMRMPRFEDGLNVIKEMHAQVPSCPITVMSNFLDDSEVRSVLGGLSFSVRELEKEHPSPILEAQFSEWVSTIRQTRSILQISSQKIASLPTPFDMAYREFENMPVSSQIPVIRAAKKNLTNQLKELFEKGSKWVLFCSDSKHPNKTGSWDDPLPSESEMETIGRDKNRVPFLFTAPTIADDLQPFSCKGVYAGYPSIDLLLNPTHDFISIHFDTGSAKTFLSYEYLTEKNSWHAKTRLLSGAVNGIDYEFYVGTKDITIRDQDTEQTKVVKLNFEAVYEWENLFLARKCDSECLAKRDLKASSLCEKRQGLIGRNIIFENKLSLTIDGENGAVCFAARQGKKNAA